MNLSEPTYASYVCIKFMGYSAGYSFVVPGYIRWFFCQALGITQLLWVAQVGTPMVGWQLAKVGQKNIWFARAWVCEALSSVT